MSDNTHYTELLDYTDLIEERDRWTYIDRLIHNSSLDERSKAYCERMNNQETEEEFLDMMIAHLLDCQVDPVESGKYYNQGDIKRKLSRHV